MNSYLSDLENIIINAQSGGQSLSFALKPCATEKSVFDKEVNITPLWLIRKQEAERKAKEETERTRLQQEAERKAKELAEERIRRGTAEPVDLGLSVLWASHNIGARSSEQPGIYAAWTSRYLCSMDKQERSYQYVGGRLETSYPTGNDRTDAELPMDMDSNQWYARIPNTGSQRQQHISTSRRFVCCSAIRLLWNGRTLLERHLGCTIYRPCHVFGV